MSAFTTPPEPVTRRRPAASTAMACETVVPGNRAEKVSADTVRAQRSDEIAALLRTGGEREIGGRDGVPVT